MATPMTPTQILTVLKAEGLTVREYPGWKTRCRCCPDTGPHRPNGPFIRAWGDVNGMVQHITGGGLGGRSVETYIRDIILNDPALPTKCQFVTAPNGDVWVVAIGRCNHAGKVGGKVRDHLRAADYSLTDDYDDRFRGGTVDGNAFTYGNEAIAASKMTDQQRASSVKLWAAVARFHGWTGQETVGHGEIASARTKADPNLDMGQFRHDIMARVKAGKTPTTPTPPKPPTTPAKTATMRVMLLPTAGYNAANAPGVTRWRANTEGLAALVNKHHPDALGVTEMSNRKINPMRPLFDNLVHMGREPGGSDGRYVYLDPDTTKHIASGHVNVSDVSELDDDDKQAAWSVFEFAGVRKGLIVLHTENESGVDKSGANKGENADDLRVDQTFSAWTRCITAMRPHGVTQDDVVFMGDFNSNRMVRDAMVARGWTPAGPGWFTRWDDTAHETFDWVFIREGSAESKVINHKYGDHTAVVVDWTFTI